MASVEASLLVEPSAAVRPLLAGDVAAQGISLHVGPAVSIDENCRAMAKMEIDLAEVSLGTFLKARDQGLPVIGLPVFTSGRQFLHGGMQVAARAKIDDLAELRDRVIGTGQYWQGPPIWQRHILKEMHGLQAEDVAWLTYRPERMEGLGVPPGVRHRLDTSGRSAAELAEAGEIDAHVARGAGPARPGGRAASGALIAAYPDKIAAERAYYERTGVLPILHLTVIREDLAADHPEVIESVCEAFSRAKTSALEHAHAGAAESEHPPELSDEELELVGGDPWPFGITPNRRSLDAFVQMAHDQGLVNRRYSVEELFVSNLPADMR
jgi:4,5-dihydroxyphthalate decarboxylase